MSNKFIPDTTNATMAFHVNGGDIFCTPIIVNSKSLLKNFLIPNTDMGEKGGVYIPLIKYKGSDLEYSVNYDTSIKVFIDVINNDSSGLGLTKLIFDILDKHGTEYCQQFSARGKLSIAESIMKNLPVSFFLSLHANYCKMRGVAVEYANLCVPKEKMVELVPPSKDVVDILAMNFFLVLSDEELSGRPFVHVAGSNNTQYLHKFHMVLDSDPDVNFCGFSNNVYDLNIINVFESKSPFSLKKLAKDSTNPFMGISDFVDELLKETKALNGLETHILRYIRESVVYNLPKSFYNAMHTYLYGKSKNGTPYTGNIDENNLEVVNEFYGKVLECHNWIDIPTAEYES